MRIAISALFAGILCCFSCGALFAADELPAEIQPAIAAELSPEGLLTAWLVSPQCPDRQPGAKPPMNARESEAAFPGGAWSLDLPGAVYNDLRKYVHVTRNPFFAATYIHSAAGGARFLYVCTYSGFKAYLGGQLIIEKPPPDMSKVTKLPAYRVPLNLAAGLNEITLEITPAESTLIQCLLFDGKAANARDLKPVPGDVIALPLAKGKPADANAAAFQCLSLDVDKSPFVAPGAKAPLVLRTHGSVPRGAAVLSARWAAENGAQPGAPAPLAAAGPSIFEFTAPAALRGVYEPRLEILAGDKSLGVKSAALICLQGCAGDAAALEHDWNDRAAKSGHSLPNSKLYLEKLKLIIDGITQGTVDPDSDTGKEILSIVDNARAFLDAEAQGKDPFDGKSGYMERGYISAIDSGVQPYIVSVPDAAVAKNTDKFPLVVFLHGYDPNMTKYRWWEAKDLAALCARNNALLAIPFGRLNTDFQSVGEVDVLDVIKEMKAHYRVDPDRVYLVGISMGGMGVYTIAAHYPDEFAAGIVLAGRADSPLQNRAALDKFHPFKQWLIHSDNPVSLCENLTNLPLHIYHGQDDVTVLPMEATRMDAALKKAGCNAKLQLIPGGHRACFDMIREEEPLRWLLTNKRNPAPAERRIKQYSLQFAKQDSVEVTAIKGALEPIQLEWSDTNGEKTFTKESGVILQKSVNGAVAPPLAAKLLKSRELCGPVRQALCAPFTIVYGTTGSAAANAANKVNAQNFAQEWLDFTRSPAQIKADTEVTDAEKHDRNLFLFGEEQDNALHAQIAKDLPIAVKNGNVTIGEKTVPLAGKGIMYIFPNPLAAMKRAVVICAGARYGEKIGVNHKLDLIPDFLLYDANAFDADGTNTNKAISAGFFNGEWKLEPTTMWWFP